MDNEKYMRRCFELAAKGKGSTSPNPLVGCVIVHKGRIIGEGYHKRAGGAHAEVNAINSILDRNLLKTSTLYVNLEPCSHHGKTPPCSDLIVKKGLAKVVIANRDPNPLVDGGGINKLKDAGIDVETDVLAKEGAELNRYFFNQFLHRRPFIILKWAETADGFIGRNSLTESETRQISGKMSQYWLHQQRAQIDAILIGVTTVFEDDPVLTTRLVPGKNPLRFVIDPNDRIPMDSRLVQDTEPLIILSNKDESSDHWQKIDCTEEGVQSTLLRILNERECLSIMIEGGAKTLQRFIDSNLWDEAFILRSEKLWVNGIAAPKLLCKNPELELLDDTKLLHCRNH